MSYTNIFGGDQIDPAPLSYSSYTFSADLTLVWPFEALDNSDVASNIIDLTASAASLLVSLPNATLASTGQSVLFNNVGSNAFTVVDYSGNTIINIPVGQAWFVYLTGNTTVNGTWRTFQYGAGTSSANAAALAGYGLRAEITKLDQNIVATDLLSNYAFTASDRAQLFCNDGGAVVWTLADAAVLGNGWFFYAVNCGSGSITIDPYLAQTIDNDPNKILAPGESCIVFCDGSNFNTVGYGRSVVSTVSAVAINAAGTGVLNLNATQIAAQVQDINGALTGNRTLDYGGGVGYWFVYNNTTGAFTTTFRVNNVDPGVTVTQGSFSILRSNGTSMKIAFTTGGGTVTSVATTSDLTGGPITTTGTLGLSNSGAAPGLYPNPAGGPVATALQAQIDSKGRITGAAEVAIAITASQVTNLTATVNALIAAALNAQEPIGSMKLLQNYDVPSNWLYANGATIGNPASNATARANNDTGLLYGSLWDTNLSLPIYTSAGVLTTRGVSAAADFAANKALALPDYRARMVLGKDSMGAAGPSSRVTLAGSGIDAESLGATGGNQYLQSHTHGVIDPGHTHGVTDPGHAHTLGAAVGSETPSTGGGNVKGYTISDTGGATTGITVNSATTGITTNNAGSGSSQNMPPTMTTNIIIKFKNYA